MQVIVIINVAVRFFNAGCGGGDGQCCKTSVMDARVKTFQHPAGLFWKKNVVCSARVPPPSKRRCLLNVGKASAVTLGGVVEY